MLLRKITKHVTDQNWFAVFIDFIIVVVGVFIGMQVANWNQEINDREEQYVILELLEQDLLIDIENIEYNREHIGYILEDYIFCLDVLASKIDVPKSEFDKHFSSLLNIPSFNQKRASFENILSSGQLDLIHNQQLANEITNYYNAPYQSWNTAMRDYTRNIIAPFIMSFDYIPNHNNMTGKLLKFNKKNNNLFYSSFINIDKSQFDVQPKTLDDYRNNLFIINILTQKVFNHQGQLEVYKGLNVQMLNLIKNIRLEQNKLK